ncbi:peptidoglycan DD-metalloendopeptidase family protein [Novosphingobium lentum]|uniref:peptidoglycan DD-metalloendopeptidase family protein n=1 Tax=Novosphingobium lentum TaxID=145287 RepID=UPI0034E2BD8B
MQIESQDGWLTRLRSWFPEREFFMRSQGQVRFIRISSRLQMGGAGLIAGAVLAWAVAMAVMIFAQFSASSSRDSLLQREAAVTTAETRVAQYRKGVGGIATDLQKRQDFIEKMVQSHLGELPADLPKGTVSDSSTEADKTVRKISMVLPEAAGLARIEARQLALVERLTRYADAQSASAETAIRRVGLNPQLMMASYNGRDAQGGPLIPMSTGPGNSTDPRFARLGASLERMSALRHGLAAIPNTLPASLEYISSGFGYRSDPFTGQGAFHAGLDFRGPIGAPIYAAATGTISFAGVRSGYGNCVEISHGNGLLTRYAHMSRIEATVGQPINAGQVIGLIGSTGRSTGPHLHFEVRINDQPVNPRPFLEANAHVFQKASAGAAAGTDG